MRNYVLIALAFAAIITACLICPDQPEAESIIPEKAVFVPEGMLAGATKDLRRIEPIIPKEVISVESESETEAVDPEVEPQEQQGPEVSKDDIDLMARLIWSECGTLGETGMRYCGSVVLNRMASDLFPDTLRGVIYQRGQYAVTWNGGINKTPSEAAYEIAKELLVNGSVLPGNVVFQAEFRQGDGVYEHIGNTYFCYKN